LKRPQVVLHLLCFSQRFTFIICSKRFEERKTPPKIYSSRSVEERLFYSDQVLRASEKPFDSPTSSLTFMHRNKSIMLSAKSAPTIYLGLLFGLNVSYEDLLGPPARYKSPSPFSRFSNLDGRQIFLSSTFLVRLLPVPVKGKRKE
jgi:hypothetical protein